MRFTKKKMIAALAMQVALATLSYADTIRVHAILAAMSDGSDAPTVTPEQIREALRLANDVYKTANVEFIFDPASDVATIPSDLLSQDCTLSPAADLNAPMGTPPACPLPPNPNNDERTRVAQMYPGKLVVYFAQGKTPVWDAGAGHWVMGGGGNWSNHVDPFVRFGPSAPGLTLAHEIGHYLHLVHTFPAPDAAVYDISHLNDAGGKKGVRSFIVDSVASNNRAQALDIFDQDLSICNSAPTVRCVTDTPPDPGPQLFSNEGRDPCNAAQGTLPFDVRWPDGSVASLTFAPDRENIMNYWDKTCRGQPARITPGQAAGVRDALENQNRAHLIASKVLYSAVWEPNDRGTRRAIGWAFADFVPRFDTEIADGRHVVHMQAYDVGGGQIRWDAVWELGNRRTTRALGWAFTDIVPRFDAEIAAGRHLVHMQAYDLGGGQIRWDAVWESGGNGTTRALGWAFNDIVPRFDEEIAAGRHLVHMQAYDLGGGQIRWDAVWESGGNGTTRALGWALQDLSGRFAQETAAGHHLVHLQAYDLGGGQIRYDAVWEAGDRGTSGVMGWGFNDFVSRNEQETAIGRRLVHQQAYDVGAGQIRYDGIWENNPDGVIQSRILSESIYRFADRFNEETRLGRHVVYMQAVVGR